MAQVVGAVMSSHLPAIGRAMARGQQGAPEWRTLFEAWAPVHEWLREARPDVAVVLYNDHGLNFFLDRMPTFAVGAAPRYGPADEALGLPLPAPFEGDEDLSWHLIDALVHAEFDLTTCQEMVVDHAFTLPLGLLWPGGGACPVRTVPVSLNAVQFPLPSPVRCWKLGEAIGRAIAAWPSPARVLIVGSGGLSHRIAGRHAGHVNRDFDLRFIESLVREPRWATRYSAEEIVERCGTHGVELLCWLAARAALPAAVQRRHGHYHDAPIAGTATGLLLLEPLGG